MAKHNHQHVAAKHTILRKVYEDNLDAGEQAASPMIQSLPCAVRGPAPGMAVPWGWALVLFPMLALAAYLLHAKEWTRVGTHLGWVAIRTVGSGEGDPVAPPHQRQLRSVHMVAQTDRVDAVAGAGDSAKDHSSATSAKTHLAAPPDMLIPVNELVRSNQAFEQAYGSTAVKIEALSTSVLTDVDEAAFADFASKHSSPRDYNALLRVSEIPIAGLFGLRARTIIIDPGHGGRDPGATGRSGLREKTVTLDIAKRLAARLKRRGNHRVLLAREDDSKLSLKERADFANRNSGDLFISIHVNYLAAAPDTVIETYYFGSHADEESLRLAAKENQNSEFTMGGFNEVIRKLGHTFKHQESKALAVAIQKNLFRNIRLHNHEVIDVGIKTAPFAVLLGVDMPSVLAEVTCLSNEQEEKRLATAKYREEIARYLEDGIVEYLDRRQPNVDTILGARRYVRNESKDAG